MSSLVLEIERNGDATAVRSPAERALAPTRSRTEPGMDSASGVRENRGVGTRRGRSAKRGQTASAVPQVVRLADVEDATSRYLVEPYLPRGAITVLEGDPAGGKSFVAADLASVATRGESPDLGLGTTTGRTAPRNVLYLTSEDSPATLRQRFTAQNADLSRVLVLPDQLSCKDLSPLSSLLEEHQPSLVVIDPLHALLDGGVNLNAANSVRQALTPLVALAVRFDLAILGVRHLAKAGKGRAVYRGLGSIDFAAVARSILRIGEDPERPGSRVLVHVKHSHGPLGAAVEFEIGDRLTWLGRCELTSADLDARPSRGRGRSAVEIAEGFLKEHLAAGAKAVGEVEAAAVAAGIAPRTLERAQAALGVRHLRVNAGGGRGRGAWLWGLPTGSAPVGDLEAPS